MEELSESLNTPQSPSSSNSVSEQERKEYQQLMKQQSNSNREPTLSSVKDRKKQQYLRGKRGEKLTLQTVAEMDKESLAKVKQLKNKETYNLVQSESTIRQIHEAIFNEDEGEYSDVDGEYRRDSNMNTKDYFNKIDYDIDPADLPYNERKLRKLYNLVHREKYPLNKLTRDTQKLFKKLEASVARKNMNNDDFRETASIFDSEN